MLVVFPDGTSVMAHGRLDVVPPDRERPPDVALYLDERWTTDPEVKWPYTFVRWADFDVPDDEGELFHALCEALQRAKAGDLVEIACDGGTGRTGTALACLAILTGVEPESAASWVRSNYHPYAVEVPEQEALIGRFVEWAERSTQALWDPARAPGWHQALEPEFGEPYWEDLEQFISEERCRYNVFPPTDDVFAAFHLTPLSETTVVIVGQDPYPTSGQAHGLCFSVRCGARVPRSLVNIKRELQDDLGMPTPRHGNLETWARRGVLLLKPR